MRKLISTFLAISMFSQVALAECDFSTGIKKTDHNTFEYSYDCHIKVGENKRDLDIATEQIKGYKKAIELKDLALDTSEKRADKWMGATYKLEDRVTGIESLQSKNYTLYYGLGVATAILAVWAAGQLRR